MCVHCTYDNQILGCGKVYYPNSIIIFRVNFHSQLLV
jgi:hypothetical protein